MRADQLLVAQGLAPTRSAAQRLIQHGVAEWASPTGWAALKKAGEDLPETAQLRVTDDAELRYVSRGGLKLEGALARTEADVHDLIVLDVGQSTGASPTACWRAARAMWWALMSGMASCTRS